MKKALALFVIALLPALAQMVKPGGGSGGGSEAVLTFGNLLNRVANNVDVSALVKTWDSGASDPSGACTPGQEDFLNTTSTTLFRCSVSGTWVNYFDSGSAHAHTSASTGGTLNASAVAAGTLPVARGGTGVVSFTASRCLQSTSDGLGIEVASGVCQAGGAGAPDSAQYITAQAEAGLSAEKSLGALADNAIVTVDVAAAVATPRAAVYTDVVPLWAAGSCTGFLKNDGTCGSGGSGSVFTMMQNMQTAVSASTTTYLSLVSGIGTEASRRLMTPLACTARNLYVTTLGTQNAGNSLVFTLRNVTGAADTALTVTVAAGAAAGTYTDLVNTASLAQGDSWVLKIVNNYSGGNSATISQVSFTCN